VRQVGYLPKLYKDAWSEKYKKLFICLKNFSQKAAIISLKNNNRLVVVL
jgi:hypothetical protein